MGPFVDSTIEALLLRPFQTSTTYQNLKRTGAGVLHITDDVDLMARAAVNRLQHEPKLIPAKSVEGYILADACRWFAFRVTNIDDRQERTQIEADIVDRGTFRDFFGFNRAKNAVLEAAILATRVGLLPAADILAELDRLALPVEKTAGRQEREAFRFLNNYVRDMMAQSDS